MRIFALVLAVLLLLPLFAACGRNNGQLPPELKNGQHKAQQDEVDSEYPLLKMDEDEDVKKSQDAALYFWDKENNRLVSELRPVMISNGDLFIREIITGLTKEPVSDALTPAIPAGIIVLKVEQQDNMVSVNLSEAFLAAEDLLAARVALVNTLTEIEGIDYVKIYINGNELTRDGTEEGEPLGVLSRYGNNLDEIAASEALSAPENNVKQVVRELYFQDIRGLYLMPEIRTITVKNNGYATAIVEEMIKGPIASSEGLYPTIPSGTQLLKANVVKHRDTEMGEGLELYFSKELKAPFLDGNTDAEAKKRKETTLLSSLIYSLTALPNIEWVQIYYKNDIGEDINLPLHSIRLDRPLTREDFPNILGRKLRIYFADENLMKLVPEYRAMNRNDMGIAAAIIRELIVGPLEKEKHHNAVFDSKLISVGDIKVTMKPDNTTVVVDLPSKLNANQMGSTGVLIAVYSIVNSLTDSLNTRNIKQVQFTVDGKVVESFGNMEFAEPFIRNPAVIRE